MSFLEDLKRRHVFRVAAAYAVVGWLLIQIATQVFPFFNLPNWSVRLIVLATLAGFPIALVLAWAFDATPHGVVRTADGEDTPPHRSQRTGIAVGLIGVLIAAIAGGGYWHFEKQGASPAAPARVAPSSIVASSTAALASPAAIPDRSIAVLPFVNMSGDPKNDYFSDGITEEILDALAHVPKLKVAARTSAFAFKGKAEDLRKVGEVLDVATVLEGSVQKSGDEVRITAQLIDVHTGYHLWSEKYDRKLTSIFAVEDEISKAIADKLQVQLADSGDQSLVPQQTIDPRAHDFYLRGLSLLAARGPGLRDAAAAFTSAVGISPQYAQAWGALAQAEVLLPDYGLGSAKDTNARALASAQHALALNPETASALVAQGMVYTDQWQWAKADAAFARALALAPGDAETVGQYGQFLAATGNFGPALMEIARAQKLDPLAPSNGQSREWTLYLSHRNDAAWAESQRNAADFPDFARAQANAAYLSMVTHHWSDAERYFRRFGALSGLSAAIMGENIDLIHGMADPALHASTALRLKTAPDWLRIRDQVPFNYSAWLCMLDDCKAALPVLEQIADQGENTDPEIIWIPAFDPIRGDPRFKAVLKKMGLPYTPAKGAAP